MTAIEVLNKEIEKLSKLIILYKENKDDFTEGYYEEQMLKFTTLKSALEKQIPTKAKYTESQSRFSECSVCGHLVSGSMDYCVHCGQKLLWESDTE